jgi:hypothetical protein
MSLNWSLEKIKDYESVCFADDKLSVETESLIWYTMFVYMPLVSESNASEFYKRIHLYEKLFGPSMSSFEDGKRIPHPVTFEMVKKHIGLHTNAESKTMAAFKKHVIEVFMKQSNSHIDAEYRKVK